jgi:cytochrome c-type biogenesis protein CcmH/NrfG
MGMVVGAVFVGIGLFFAIPVFGAFGIFWTFVAAAITIFHAFNVFSERGVATTEIDVEVDGIPTNQREEMPFDERLRRLEQLRHDALISEEEYQHKRREILRQQW